MRLAFESVDSVKYTILSNVEGHQPNLLRDWIPQKAEEERIHALPAWPAWAGTLVSSCPWPGIYNIGSFGF